MVIEKNFIFFKAARIIFDDDILQRALAEKRYTYISGISYDGTLRAEGLRIKAKKTPVIQLYGMNKETILTRFNETTRNEINRTFQMPELRFVVPDANRNEIHKLYKNFEIAGGRPPRRIDFFKESFLVGAYRNTMLIAAIIAYDTRPYLRVNAIVSVRGVNRELSKLVSFSTRRLVYELCRYGADNGYELLDLGGVNLTDETKAGITAFKMSFGGKLVDEFTYTYKSPFFSYVHSIFHKRG